MERDYDEYLDSIKISSFMRDMKYHFYTDMRYTFRHHLTAFDTGVR